MSSRTSSEDSSHNTINVESINSRGRSIGSKDKIIFQGRNNHIYSRNENVETESINSHHTVIVKGDSLVISSSARNVKIADINSDDTIIIQGNRDTLIGCTDGLKELQIDNRGKQLIDLDSLNHVEKTGVSDYKSLAYLIPDSALERKIVSYYTDLIKKGSSQSAFTLAMLYESGTGVPQNSMTAAYYLKIAADMDNEEAEQMLGLYFENGIIGGKPDYTAARKWYLLAAKHGNNNAIEGLERLDELTWSAK